MTESVSIIRPTITYNSIGEKITTPVIHIVSLPCSFQIRTGDKSILSNVEGVRQNIRMYCNIANINENDIVKKNDIDYEIILINKLSDNHMQIDLRKKR